ncbi:MAG TPA: plastocyanin/azurin family copper-binding protein [Gemmatimonadales bacterium]|jgi:plastocyanin
MRVSAIVAGVALAVAACGGKGAPAAADSNQPAAPTAAAPAATGATHEIQMVQEGANSYKFMPDTLTIKQGDVVVFKGISGNGHDVAFYPDSIPAGAAAVLNAAITDQSQPLATNMIADGQSVSISFAGAPVGVYKFYCIPHAPMGMKGQLTVTQ